MSATTLSRINNIFKQVFDDAALDVSRATTAEDIEGWDSLTHVNLMLNVEKAYAEVWSAARERGVSRIVQVGYDGKGTPVRRSPGCGRPDRGGGPAIFAGQTR